MSTLKDFWSNPLNIVNASPEDIQKDILAYLDQVEQLQAELTKEREANKKMLSGLEWYGNELRYYMPTELLNDNGRRARYIISSVEEGNEPNEG
jgi:hypothetical protein